MSLYSYIAFPKSFNQSQLHDPLLHEQGELEWWDGTSLPASCFKDCFDNGNGYIYPFDDGWRYSDTEEYEVVYRKIYGVSYYETEGWTQNEIEKEIERVKNWNIEARNLRNKFSYFLEKNLQKGEFVEVYSEWAKAGDIGPPTKETSVTLKEIMNEGFSFTEDKVKIKIIKE